MDHDPPLEPMPVMDHEPPPHTPEPPSFDDGPDAVDSTRQIASNHYQGLVKAEMRDAAQPPSHELSTAPPQSDVQSTAAPPGGANSPHARKTRAKKDEETTDPPPPSAGGTVHDDLLAAFLADAPLESKSNEPPKD